MTIRIAKGSIVTSANRGSRKLEVLSLPRRLDGDSRGCVDVTWAEDAAPNTHPTQRRGFQWTECVCNLTPIDS